MLTHPPRHAGDSTQASMRSGRGFSLIQMLFAIAVLALLISILIVGLKVARSTARAAADTQTLSALRMGIDSFTQNFGFPPLLVKDQATNPQWVVQLPLPPGSPPGTPAPNGIAVYQNGKPADAKFLRATGVTFDPDNPFAQLDRRFSTCSLAYYIAGVLEYPAYNGAAYPIDGVPGPGIRKPVSDGTFLDSGGTFQPPIDVTKGSLRLTRIDNSTTSQQQRIEIQDQAGQPIRFYRWLTGVENPPGSGKYTVSKWEEQNIPPMVVGADYRDYTASTSADQRRTNPALNEATWAIVAAGPNGVFGDEPVAQIRTKLNLSTDVPEARVRYEAAKDNLVESGK